MRIMLDTNILISVIFFPSNQTENLIKRITEQNEIVICDYVIEELSSVIERKFLSRKSALKDFFHNLPFDLVQVKRNPEKEKYPEIRDEKDFPILVTAIESDIDIFLTGDKDFLAVKNLDRPKIMTMTEYLEK
ncbi:putative toxin-antitoxin system toxin component, PIN family [Oribacterium parvum]